MSTGPSSLNIVYVTQRFRKRQQEFLKPSKKTILCTAWAGILHRVSAYEHCHAFGSSNFRITRDVTRPWGIGVATCPKGSFPRRRESTGCQWMPEPAPDSVRVKPGMTCRRDLYLWTMAFWRQLLEETPQDGLTSCQVRNITYPLIFRRG